MAITALIRKVRISGNTLNISDIEQIDSFIQIILEIKNVVLTGEPGSGKSWFVNNLIARLKTQDIAVMKHYCYIDIYDIFQKERIKINRLYGNLVSEILNIYPELKTIKMKKFASSLNELNNLIGYLEHQTVLIIDGLDHINRVFEFQHYDDLSKNEIDIIHEISKITKSAYLSILVVTQPIKELDDIIGFSRYSIPSWGNTETIKFLQKMHVADIMLDNDKHLSYALFEKSGGNPLYLTYLVEELNKTNLSVQSLQALPAYSFNLKEYYHYLLNKLNMRELPAMILSVIDFSVTTKELGEITGSGRFVDESVDILRPILRFNHSSNGYSIYHESFRRFMVDYLDEKEVNFNIAAFDLVIAWFAKQDFYTTPKVYRFYLDILLKAEKYNIVSDIIQPDFVRKSLYVGQPYEIIKNNYNLMCIGAIKTQGIKKLVILNELNKMISLSEDTFISSVALYYKAMGNIIGFDNVSKNLLFENKPLLPFKEGLDICYLLDEMGYMAPWDSYISYFDTNGKIDIEDFDKYIRFLFIQKDKEATLDIFERLESNSLNEYQAIFRKELDNPAIAEFRKELCVEFPKIEDFLSCRHIKTFENTDLEEITEKILSLEFISDKESMIINIFLI